VTHYRIKIIANKISFLSKGSKKEEREAAGITDGASLFAVGAVGTFIGMVASAELSNGVIVYFKRAPLGQYYPSQIRQQ